MLLCSALRVAACTPKGQGFGRGCARQDRGNLWSQLPVGASSNEIHDNTGGSLKLLK